MKKAIITGSTGLVGATVARFLYSKNIDVLCLGRKDLGQSELKNLFGIDNVNYLKIDMKNISTLSDAIELINWLVGDSCVFYNFAWSGEHKLTDGDFEVQLKNAIYSSNAVKVAKEIGCIKFVNVGSLEETYAEMYIKNTLKTNRSASSQDNYAISKLASRDMCKMVAYLEKIDYIHTRLSVPLDQNLGKGGYISSVLLKIKNGQDYELPKNKQLFDIILTNDVGKAYYLIGEKGKNKADYYIGASQPKTLQQYFEIFKQIRNKGYSGNQFLNEEEKGDTDIFNTDKLKKDTGFVLSNNFEEIANKIVG